MQVLEVDRRIVDARPLGLVHRDPAAIGVETPPLIEAAVLRRGMKRTDIFVQALGSLVGLMSVTKPYLSVNVDRLDPVDRLLNSGGITFSPWRFQDRWWTIPTTNRRRVRSTHHVTCGLRRAPMRERARTRVAPKTREHPRRSCSDPDSPGPLRTLYRRNAHRGQNMRRLTLPDEQAEPEEIASPPDRGRSAGSRRRHQVARRRWGFGRRRARVRTFLASGTACRSRWLQIVAKAPEPAMPRAPGRSAHRR